MASASQSTGSRQRLRHSIERRQNGHRLLRRVGKQQWPERPALNGEQCREVVGQPANAGQRAARR
ncbi:MAG: hypothetical protein ACK463_18860, partial [Bradyrhizobium sp.]